MSESKAKSLATKLSEIIGEIGLIKPRGYNKPQDYYYFTEAQTLAEVRARFAARHIVMFTSVEDVQMGTVTTQKGSTLQLVTVRTAHVIRDGETGESITFNGAGQGTDSGDKGLPKAITGAVKYALLKTFLITDEWSSDPEAAAARELADGKKAPHSQTKQSPNEERKGKDVPTAKADLVILRAWQKENDIPDAFILKLAAEGKMAASETSLDELKPGTITRLLGLRARILSRWKESQGGSATEKPVEKAAEKPVVSKTTQRGEDEAISPRKPVKDHDPIDFLSRREVVDWRAVAIHFGTKSGQYLGELEKENKLAWWINKWAPKLWRGKFKEEDLILDAALCVAAGELA